MTLTLNEKFIGNSCTEAQIAALAPETENAFRRVLEKNGRGADFLGWVDLPIDYDREEFARIKAAAQKIRGMCDIFVVLGIGGSYLGARAAVEFVKSPLFNALPHDGPDIYFAGNTISPSALCELLTICKGKDICVNVISKSGTTTETAVAFRVFRKLLVEKYGEQGARERIFATTDKARGTLKASSDREGYQTFVIPDDVGGRYSVLTAVGLLPIAVAGISIDDMMKGAADARAAYQTPDIRTNTAMRYAAIRQLMYRGGKKVEMLVGYDPYLQMTAEWWKQLFGESEGKENKGLLPHSVIYTTDLHSMGQYLQQGERLMFETVLQVNDQDHAYKIPDDPTAGDGLDYLCGRELADVNHTAMLGTLFAHADGDVPNLVIEVSERSAYSFGYLVYFFEMACACSGYMMGVNPFDQPGVESYKKNMFALLGKPGYEELRQTLSERMK